MSVEVKIITAPWDIYRMLIEHYCVMLQSAGIKCSIVEYGSLNLVELGLASREGSLTIPTALIYCGGEVKAVGIRLFKVLRQIATTKRC